MDAVPMIIRCAQHQNPALHFDVPPTEWRDFIARMLSRPPVTGGGVEEPSDTGIVGAIPLEST